RAMNMAPFIFWNLAFYTIIRTQLHFYAFVVFFVLTFYQLHPYPLKTSVHLSLSAETKHDTLTVLVHILSCWLSETGAIFLRPGKIPLDNPSYNQIAK
ncbi:hypothetical protein ABND44_20530, partial [Paenibacillus larvae]